MADSMSALYLQNPALAQAMRRQRFGEQLMAQGADASPVQHPLQGLARLAAALVGGYEQRKGDEAITAEGKRQSDETAALMAEALGPMPQMAPQGAPQQPQPMTAPMQPVAQQRLTAPGAMPDEELTALVGPLAQKYGVPLPLALAIVKQESGGRPGIIGDGGRSVGLGQIRDDTARDPGYGVPPMDPALRNDPRANVDFMLNYYTQKGRHFGAQDFNNPEHQDIALKAYNGGGDPNYVRNVRQWMPQSAPSGETIPAAMPQGDASPAQAQGAPTPRTPDAQAYYMAEAQRLQALAMRAQRTNPALANVLMQRAQMAHQAGMARAPQPDETERLFALAGIDRNSPEGQRLARQILEKKGNPQTVVNTGENYAQRKAIDDWGVAKAAASDTARRTTLFDTALSVMDNDAFQPGATAEIRLKVAQLGEALGLETNAPAGEVLKAVQRQLELANTPKGQGQITENERVLIREMLPVMGSTPDGLRMLIEATKLLDARDKEVFTIYNESARANGGVPSMVDVNEKLASLPPALPPVLIARLNKWKEVGPSTGGEVTPTGQGGAQGGGGGWSIRRRD